MTSSPDRHMQGIERTSRRGSESSQFYPASEFLSHASAPSVEEEPAKYICPTCSKRFNRQSSLRIHINTHTGATPFQCPFPNCEREFNVHSNIRRHFRKHTSSELSCAQPHERQYRHQAHDPDLVFVTGGTSGQPPPYPFNDLAYQRPHQDSMHHIPRTYEPSISDESEDYQSLTGYHRCNDDYRHTRHIPVSRSHAPLTRSWPENEDIHVGLSSRKSHPWFSPSQSDLNYRLDVNITTSPRKRRMSMDSASEPSSSPAPSPSDNFFNISNSARYSVDYSSLDSLHNNSSGTDQHIVPRFSAASVNYLIPEYHYSASPPNTGNSTTLNVPFNTDLDNPTYSQSHMADIEQGPDSANRIYPFVALPGNGVEKMPRRHDEIERLYRCSWPNCTKAYCTLVHLNAHVTMEEHGPKRSHSEFIMELRKQRRRKAKKEAEGTHPVGASARRGDNSRFNDSNMYSPACNGGTSAPCVQTNTSHHRSNSDTMAKTFSTWSSPMVANENRSRPGSAQSGSPSVSDFSRSSLVFSSPSYNKCSSSPNPQSNTSHSEPSWSNLPSPRAPNKNHSRPGSAQSGSSGGRSDSP